MPLQDLFLANLISRANEVLTSAKRLKKGEVIELDTKMLNMGYYNKHVQSSLTFSLYQSTNTLFFTSSQIITDMSSMSLSEDGLPVVLHFLAAVMFYTEVRNIFNIFRFILKIAQNMANDLETLFTLREWDHSTGSNQYSERIPGDWLKTVWEYEDSTSAELLYVFVSLVYRSQV